MEVNHDEASQERMECKDDGVRLQHVKYNADGDRQECMECMITWLSRSIWRPMMRLLSKSIRKACMLMNEN